ncbi:kinase-like domain-containing protein [Xylaria intraflava]|nr:kinase-like domain-containing protein [Xylaria intraflava]
MNQDKGKRLSDDDELVSYAIPLLPYEKSLILDVGKFLNSGKVSDDDLGKQCSAAEAFENWRWYKVFSTQLPEELDPEDPAQYGGGRELAYDRCLQVIANTELDDKHLCRVNAVRSRNVTFLEDLGDMPCDRITFNWPESDADSWEVVSRIVNAFGQPWRHSDRLHESSSRFEIWELVRIFFLHAQCPGNADLIKRHLIQHPVFEFFFDVSGDNQVPQYSNDSQSSQSKQLFKSLVIRKHNVPEVSSQAHLPHGDGLNNIDRLLKSLLHKVARQQGYQDPRAYLRFIPWDDLKPISLDTLKSFGIDPGLLLKYETTIDQWVLWDPPFLGYATNHHLFVEDELFAYSMDKGWPLPGHYLEGRVIFGVESLFDCSLVSELGDFWRKWNDCAITKRDDGEVCVLQTLPGIHLRLRTAELDYQAALRYYRSITEAHATGRPSAESVKELLGVGDSYSYLYENTLRLIPDSTWTLRDIDWEAPIAKNSRSAVYAATLCRQQTVLSTSERGDVAVVLKDVIPRGSREVTEKFLKELDATWFALGGKALSCVEFYGLARVEFEDTHRLMLVSQRATQGSIMDFLEREFKKESQHRERWDLLGSVLMGISSGLRWIHEHNVVHRDLHPGNIFVTDHVYRLDPNIPHEYNYLIGDLGEGKKLDASASREASQHASYGAVDYRAPEQSESGFDHNSLSAGMVAEVFSFGKLACKLLEWHVNFSPPRDSIPDEVLADVSGSCTPEDLSEELDFLVPTTIRDTIGLCLTQFPGMRPRMEEVQNDLEYLWCDLREDHSADREEDLKVKWCIWNWEKFGTASSVNLEEDSEEVSPAIDPYDI